MSGCLCGKYTTEMMANAFYLYKESSSPISMNPNIDTDIRGTLVRIKELLYKAQGECRPAREMGDYEDLSFIEVTINKALDMLDKHDYDGVSHFATVIVGEIKDGFSEC